MPTDLPPDYKPKPLPEPANDPGQVPAAPGEDLRDPAGGDPHAGDASLPGNSGDIVIGVPTPAKTPTM